MNEKLSDSLELEDAIVDSDGAVIEEIDVTPAKYRNKPTKRKCGFFQMPTQIMARLEIRGVSMPAWCVLCSLQREEFKAWKKGEPIKVSNKILKIFGGTRWVKLDALDELVKREFILPYVRGTKSHSPKVKMNLKLQK